MALDQVDVDKLDEKGVEKEMTFFEHLEELRWHILRSMSAILLFGIAAFVGKDFIFNTIIFGPKNKDFITYEILCNISESMGLGQSLCIGPPDFDFVTPNFGELFLTHIKVSFIAGIICSIPYLFWEIWRFVKPGLYEHEKNMARYSVGVCSALFLFGVAFGYFIISPFAITFLAGYELPGVVAQPSLGSYINYMVMLTLPVGLVFEMPVAVYVLTRLGLLTSDFMKTYRRHAYLIILVMASIITPPDVFSQILICVPLILLYEVSISISKKVEKKERALMKRP
ncbi:MAG TPA: twin-arginine translocase subunit TatC [Bacteroidetes bacterium]|nr:twin-arginine translocase subunit TatC [Bacteroidota bacterium]